MSNISKRETLTIHLKVTLLTKTPAKMVTRSKGCYCCNKTNRYADFYH